MIEIDEMTECIGFLYLEYKLIYNSCSVFERTQRSMNLYQTPLLTFPLVKATFPVMVMTPLL